MLSLISLKLVKDKHTRVCRTPPTAEATVGGAQKTSKTRTSFKLSKGRFIYLISTELVKWGAGGVGQGLY